MFNGIFGEIGCSSQMKAAGKPGFVELNSLHRDFQDSGNLLACPAFRHQLENLPLSCGQPVGERTPKPDPESGAGAAGISSLDAPSEVYKRPDCLGGQLKTGQ